MGQGTLFHDVHAQWVVRHLNQIVEASRCGGQGVHVLWKTFPVPHNAFVQSSAWNIFHAFHEFDQIVFVTRALGGKAHTTIAHDQSGHTMVDAGGETFIPSGLAVVVGVKVYETRRDPQTRGVHGFFGGIVDCANADNQACLDADVCTEGCTA